MDSMDVLSNKEQIIPYFKPVFSADGHRIAGYEVWGRLVEADGTAVCLKGFFEDHEIPDEYKVEVADHIASSALERYLDEKEEGLVFLHRDARLLMLDHGESFLQLLQQFEERGFSLDRIVLGLSEYAYTGDFEQLVHLLVYYKTYGIKISMNNIAENGGQLEKLSFFSPDILRVNLYQLRNDAGNKVYKDILYSLSVLARKIGASLLYEGIEINYQLQFAWLSGGRFYQGDYLHKESSTFLDPDILKPKLKQKYGDFIRYETKHLNAGYDLADLLHKDTGSELLRMKKENGDFDGILMELANHFSDKAFRLYICNEVGFQVSSNVLKVSGTWAKDPSYIGKNWSWRPYFLENIIRMRMDKKGLLSDMYSDIDSGESIRTFSFPLGNEHYLFMDLSYEFLFEEDSLLY
ncbi:EAL-associated domain-containing protein [Rossellomorea marisflavi]|uniref:EAL-associated domain-containing protein n=1 Tax=Rossellomorea marisflavi TaxID=189381 RepID=UPI00345B204B